MKKYFFIIIFIILLAGMLLSLFGCINDSMKFDKIKWASNPELRGKMANDLVKNCGLVGMSADEVVKLLGNPDVENEDYFSYNASRNSTRDFSYVELKFEDGKVVSAEYKYVT